MWCSDDITGDGARVLAALILLRAVDDICPPFGRVWHRLRREAPMWLYDDPWAAELAMAVDVDPVALRDWAMRRTELVV